jgi:hypothetical protein
MNIPLTSFTLFDGTPLGKYTDRAPGFDGGALRWDNARAQPAIVTMVSAILNNAQFGDVLTRIQLAAIRIGGSDSPSFDVTLRPMVMGHICPGDPVELTSPTITSAGFQVIEASRVLPTDKGTVCYELSIQPTPCTLINDDVALLAVEWDRAS